MAKLKVKKNKRASSIKNKGKKPASTNVSSVKKTKKKKVVQTKLIKRKIKLPVDESATTNVTKTTIQKDLPTSSVAPVISTLPVPLPPAPEPKVSPVPSLLSASTTKLWLAVAVCMLVVIFGWLYSLPYTMLVRDQNTNELSVLINGLDQDWQNMEQQVNELQESVVQTTSNLSANNNSSNNTNQQLNELFSDIN